MPENTISLVKTNAPAADSTESTYALTVAAADWSRYLKLKAERAALEKAIKALESGFGFPDAETLAASFGLATSEGMSIEIRNGNGDTCGKYTVFYFPGSETPPAWRKRIS